MKPKMKKNPNYRGHGRDNSGDDGHLSGIRVDKKNIHRKERRVFNPGNIKRYYTELIEPALKEEEAELEKEDYNERGEWEDHPGDDKNS